jgi:hypothetical protein
MSLCKYQRSPNNHSFMRQSQRGSSDQASLRRAMVCHRRIQVVGGVVRCLLNGLQPVCLNWRCWFPSSIEMICESCFQSCNSLASVTFDANSRLSRLEKVAFSCSGLQSIHLPGSLEVICESCFMWYTSLASVTFDANSRLSRLEKEAFRRSGLQSIHLPGSLEVICESCFSSCNFLTSIAFDPRSLIRAQFSDLQAGIQFDCRSLDATLGA